MLLLLVTLHLKTLVLQVGRETPGLLTAAEEVVLAMRTLTVTLNSGQDLEQRRRGWLACMRLVCSDQATAAALVPPTTLLQSGKNEN